MSNAHELFDAVCQHAARLRGRYIFDAQIYKSADSEVVGRLAGDPLVEVETLFDGGDAARLPKIKLPATPR